MSTSMSVGASMGMSEWHRDDVDNGGASAGASVSVSVSGEEQDDGGDDSDGGVVVGVSMSGMVCG